MAFPRRPLPRLIAGSLLLASTWVRADTVVLRNKSEYVGRIVSQDAVEVTMDSGGTRWTFKRDKIASMKRNAAEAAHDAALARKAKARAAADQARRARLARSAAPHPATHATSAAVQRGSLLPSPAGQSPPPGDAPNDQTQRLQQLLREPIPPGE
jgi:hypothetical protein